MTSSRKWRASPATEEHTHGFVISRKQDVQRRTHFFKNIPNDLIKISVIDAVDGSRPDFNPAVYRAFYRGYWRGNSNVPHGAFAVLLSHTLAWQRILDEGLTRAFIFEDDAIVSRGIQDAMAEWPGYCDLLFVNHRSDTWTYGIKGGRLSPCADSNQTFTKWVLKKLAGKAVDTADIEERRQREAVSVREAAKNVIRRRLRPGKEVAWVGGEGYGLTHLGAERLLQYMSNIGAVINLDFFLIAAGLGQADLEEVDQTCAGVFREMKMLCSKEPVVNAAISGNPCVKAVPKRVGGSVKPRPMGVPHR